MQNLIQYPMVKSEGDRVWRKYCGFLDLPLEQFLTVQEALLSQQIQHIARSPLGARLIGEKVPRNVDEFRSLVPLTSYKDYLPELDNRTEDALPEKPYVWAHTSRDGNSFKTVPYTLEFYNRALDNLMAIFILSCSKKRGQSAIAEGDRVLFNVAPRPYLSGILASGAAQRFNLRGVLSPDAHDSLDFRDKITKGFETSLRTGVDILIAMTSVLVKVGNEFNGLSHRSRLSRHLHPVELYRLSHAFVQSKLEKRSILPKDLWPTKAIIGWGIDTSIYRDLVYQQWGAYPYEFHACTEAGIMAVQSWTRKGLTFIPHSNFFEFIPESEYLKSQDNVFYEPRTLLLSEVKPNERYELVITSFYGMPFVRYRLGHLIRITALADREAEIFLPQMVFETRADDTIDIAGFTRIDEKSVALAIANTGLRYEDWTIRKEVVDTRPKLHLYMELAESGEPAPIAAALNEELMKTDTGYRDLAAMMDIHPLEVTLLRAGTFKDYYLQRKQSGAELTQRKPPRINAPDDAISQLVHLNSQEAACLR